MRPLIRQRSESIHLLNDQLACRAAEVLFVEKPYPHVDGSAIDPWLVFHDFDLLTDILSSVKDLLRSLNFLPKHVVALSYWGFPFAVAVACMVSQEREDKKCGVMCLGGDVFPEPLQLSLIKLGDGEEVLLVDDTMHTGGTLRHALVDRLEPLGFLSKLCIVLLDQDMTSRRQALEELVRDGKCKIYTVTRTSLAVQRRQGVSTG